MLYHLQRRNKKIFGVIKIRTHFKKTDKAVFIANEVAQNLKITILN